MWPRQNPTQAHGQNTLLDRKMNKQLRSRLVAARCRFGKLRPEIVRGGYTSAGELWALSREGQRKDQKDQKDPRDEKDGRWARAVGSAVSWSIEHCH
ncbi:hypothetical protein SBV1_1500024 [Verrucomicrobia bacterium]|nr:hypothetical protein SBV1_1500024 [Verrucomicrobiota bacterium]